MSPSRFTAGLLRRSARSFARATVARIGQQRPDLLEQRLPSTFADPVADLEVRILQLAEAVAFGAHALFADVVQWYHTAFAHRGVPADYLPTTLRALHDVLWAELPEDQRHEVAECLLAAGRTAQTASVELPTELPDGAPHVDLARRFLLEVLEGRADAALAKIRRALDDGIAIDELHDHVLARVQREVGRMWLMTEIPIADEHLSSMIVGRALHLVDDRLPLPAAGAPRVTCFSVGGNLHDIGLRIVAQRLQLAGFAVTNYGSSLPASDLGWALSDRRPELVAVAVGMLLHLGGAADTCAELRRACGPDLPILLGGPPFARVPDLHRRLGADAGAADAAQAVELARRLVPQRA